MKFAPFFCVLTPCVCFRGCKERNQMITFCPDCYEEVSTDAWRCRQCGAALWITWVLRAVYEILSWACIASIAFGLVVLFGLRDPVFQGLHHLTWGKRILGRGFLLLLCSGGGCIALAKLRNLGATRRWKAKLRHRSTVSALVETGEGGPSIEARNFPVWAVGPYQRGRRRKLTRFERFLDSLDVCETVPDGICILPEETKLEGTRCSKVLWPGMTSINVLDQQVLCGKLILTFEFWWLDKRLSEDRDARGTLDEWITERVREEA